MREASFIKQNKENWLEFEKYLYHDHKVSAERLSELFVQLNNDLAYTQTFYPKSRVNDYLNALTSNAYLKVVKPKTAYGSVLDFWKHDVPKITYKYRKYIYFTFILFFLMFGIGMISSLYEDGFIRSILGDRYVNLTEENIAHGDPAAIYTNQTGLGDIGSFLGITINNIKVGLLMYIMGITLGIGTIKVLFSNCIMLGSFLTMFYKYDVLAESMRAIWIHGAMEIFGMVIEASAGLLLGIGWLFPGSLTRKQAFMSKGKESLMIVISTIPFTIAAGLMEGFVTQLYNDMPLWLALTIIFGTLAVISYYYLVYPIRYNNRQNLTFEAAFAE
ncbi:stage II sporulation protein M [bacterium]|nr:stage II sporulation protein M [bacterium]